MEIDAYGATNVGKVRAANEDSFLIDQEMRLYIVADGMGGHQGGGYASSHAVEGIKEEAKKLEQTQDTTQPLPDGSGRTPSQMRLHHALVNTNEELHKKAQEDSSLRGMGTTVTAMQVDGKYVNIAHVGDSRLYVLRGEKLLQVTKDHSWVQEQVDAGVLNEEEAKSHPLKNIITRSMGHDRDLTVDLLKIEYKPGDKYLICSDGLTNMVEDETIKQEMRNGGPQQAVDRLVELALEGGGQDNITVVLVEIKE